MSEQLIGCGPLADVSGPPPFAPRYGLLQAAAANVAGVRFVTDPSERWGNGVEMQPYPAHAGALHSPYIEGTFDDIKDDGVPVQNPRFFPVTAYVADRCSAFVVNNDEEYRDRIRLKLEAVESSQVAQALLAGTQVPIESASLSDGEGVFPNGNTATALPLALALLENAIGASGRDGVIHMSPAALTLLAAAGHVIDPDPLGRAAQSVLRTQWGTLVVPDAGYSLGADPEGHSSATSSQEWIYASGPVDVYRMEMFINPETIAEALDRGMGATLGNTNTITYRAERNYLIAFDNTLQAAVLATIA